MRPQDLIFYAGGECLEKYGVLVKRTSPAQDVPESHVRSSTGYFIDRNGILRIAAQNVPRIEWLDLDGDGIRETPVLLLEGQRTNAWTYSEQLNNGVYTKTRCSISPDAVVAPDGFTTADKIVEDGSAGVTHFIKRSAPALTDDTDQALSFFAKPDERPEVRVITQNKAGLVLGTWFDLSTGVAGGSDHLSTRMEALGDGWYFCEVIWDSASGGTPPVVEWRMGSGSETQGYNGDGSSGLYVWGVQFEVDQPFASSYIATVATTVTRNADVLSFPFPFPPQEMTVYLKFIQGGTLLQTGKLFHIGAASGGTDPRLDVQVSGGLKYQFIWDNGTLDQNAVLAVAPSIGDMVEIRCTLSALGAMVIGQSINGGAETTASAAGGALTAAFADQLFYLNSGGAASQGFLAFESVKIESGIKTMQEMRAAA